MISICSPVWAALYWLEEGNDHQVGGGGRAQGFRDQEEKVPCFLTQDRERAMIIGIYQRFKEFSSIRWETTARAHGSLQSHKHCEQPRISSEVGCRSTPQRRVFLWVCAPFSSSHSRWRAVRKVQGYTSQTWHSFRGVLFWKGGWPDSGSLRGGCYFKSSRHLNQVMTGVCRNPPGSFCLGYWSISSTSLF